MNAKLDPTLLPALDKIYEVLGQRPAPRSYAPQPAEDFREEEPAEPRNDERYFLDEMCPSDRHFGR